MHRVRTQKRMGTWECSLVSGEEIGRNFQKAPEILYDTEISETTSNSEINARLYSHVYCYD
jgi:hypothetical protein